MHKAMMILVALTVFLPTDVPAFNFKEAPSWRTGDEWHYVGLLQGDPGNEYYHLSWRAGGKTTLISKETNSGHEQLMYYTSDMAYVGSDGAAHNMMNGGEKFYTPVLKFSPPVPHLTWPLEAGKKWGGCYTNLMAPGGTQCIEFLVVRHEDVTVPAGRFRSAVIEGRIIIGNEHLLMYRRWYAPAIKNLVREEMFVPQQNERLKMVLELRRTNVNADLVNMDLSMEKFCEASYMVYNIDSHKCQSAISDPGG